MPFNPDEFLSKKMAAQPAAGTGDGFNPDAFLAARAGQAEQAAQMPEPSISTDASLARGAAQGATLGFGDEASAAVGALFSTPTDDALDRGWKERYSAIRDQLRKENKEAKDANPKTFITGEILGGAVTGGAPGAGLAKAGLKSAVSQGATLGGLAGLGTSEKKDVSETVVDTVVGAGLGAAFGAALESFGKMGKEAKDLKLFSSKENAVDELGNLIQQSLPKKATQAKDGSFQIQYGDDLKKVFKLSKEEVGSLSDPNVQAQVTTRLYDFAENQIPQQLQATRANAANAKAAELVKPEIANSPIDLEGAFKSIYDDINKLQPGKNNREVFGAKEDLLALVKQTEDSLRAQSPSSTLKDVPLIALDKEKGNLGSVIFGQAEFRRGGLSPDGRSPTEAIHAKASKFFGELSGAIRKNDPSNGKLADLDDVMTATYRMEADRLTPAKVKGLADPQNQGATNAYIEFKKHWESIDPVTRATYGKELQDMMEAGLQKHVDLARVMQMVTGRGASNKDLNVVNLVTKINDQVQARIANTVGNLANDVPPAPFSLSNLPAPNTRTITRTVAPGLNALRPSRDEAPQKRALNELAE